ncbi:MAG: energy-coupling factor transporter ATPase [Oscillospiraceae bacterium]|nr:energy-coupling factor transporter ATPase [Oscillospiraceae bacterium]
MQIEFKDVSYVYGQNTPFEKKALDEINITIEEGLITGLIGHTGSGKSTLALLVCGLLRPNSGSIFIGGEETYKAERTDTNKKKRGAKKSNRKNSEKMKFKAGIIFQYPEYQLFEETVYKDISYGPVNMGLDKNAVDAKVREAAEFAGIPESLFEASPFELSGGQRRRAAIAGVIAMDPPILILDEPAAGLDPRGREEILGGLCAYQEITKKTMIMISHSMEDMAKYSHRIHVLREGRAYMYGTTDEIFSQADKLKETGLSVPQITGLFLELRNRGVETEPGIYNIEQAENEIVKLLKKPGKGEKYNA